MPIFEYDSLVDVISKHGENVEYIKREYLLLLSHLTFVENVSTQMYVDTIQTISKMGDIIICYYNEYDSNQNIHIVGTGTIIYEPKIIHGCKIVGHVEDIVVDANFRSNGIAKQILNELVRRAEQKNCYKVILDCKPDLVQFYEKNGFIKNGFQMSMYF